MAPATILRAASLARVPTFQLCFFALSRVSLFVQSVRTSVGFDYFVLLSTKTVRNKILAKN